MAIKESITYVMDLVDKYTGPAQKVLSSADKMGNEFDKLNGQLQKAGTVKADLNHFDSLNNKLKLNSESLADARNKAKLLGREIAATENPTKKQTAAFSKARAEVNRLQRTQTKYRQDITALSVQLDKVGISTKDMGLAHRKADMDVKRLTKSLDKQVESMRDLALQQAKIDKYSAKAKSIRGSVGVADIAAAGGGVYAIKKMAEAYGEIATAQGELESLGMNDNDIGKVTEKARQFSNKFAGFQQAALISATYDLKSGMSSLGGEALAGYLEISAKVAGGTKASIEQVTGLMATGYGIYRDGFEKFGQETIKGWEKLSQDEKDIKFGEYFGAGIAAAVQQFKTDGSQMTDAIKNIGKVAETSNVSMAEQLAILGTLQTTMSGSEAATKYKSFLNTAVNAGDKLGLSVTDQNNQLLSTVEIIQVLKSKYGETLDDMEKADLKKAFGSDEAMAYITLMYDKTESLRESTNNLGSAMNRGRSVYGEMADAIMKGGPAESLQLLDQVTKNTMADLGYGFAPVIAQVAGVVGSASNTFGNFLRENEGLAEFIGYATTALVALKVTTVASKFVFGGFFDVLALGNKAFLFYKTATMGAAVGTGVLAKAQMVLNAVMAANPIGLVVAGVTALIGVGYLLYKNWDKIGGWFKGVFASIGETVNSIGKGIYDMWSSVFNGLLEIILAPFNAMKETYNWVMDFLGLDGAKSMEVTKQIKNEVSQPDSSVSAGGIKGKGITAGNISSNHSNKSVQIHSNDVYQFHVPETNDPQMVKQAIREELASVEREKTRKHNRVMFDNV